MNSSTNTVKKEVIGAVCLVGFFTVLLIVSIRMWRLDMSIPFFYGFEGSKEGFNIVSSICDGSMGTVPVEYSPLYVWELRILYAVTGSVGYALNWSFLMNLCITAAVTYVVLKKLKISVFASIMAAVSFALLSYGFVQESYYSGMSMCCFIPLGVWLCIWIFEEQQPFSGKNIIIPLIFVALIGLTGGGYYLFFTCIMILTAGVSALLKTKRMNALWSGLALTGEAVIIQIILSIGHPYIQGDIEKSEVLGLKIFQFFVPTNSLKIGMFEEYMQDYNTKSIYINENAGSYLGIIGIIGFVMLVLTLLVSMNNKNTSERVRLYSEVMLVLIFVGEIGGIGTLLVVLTGTRLVAFNRVSVFIACLCIFAAAFLIDSIMSKISKKLALVVFTLAVTGLTAVSVMSQVPQSFYTYTEKSAVEYPKVIKTAQVGGVR